MTKSDRTDPSDFHEIERHVKSLEIPGRGTHLALLLWFLRVVYRLDDVESEDAVCDGAGDRGFDALAVDDVRQEVVAFQSKRREGLPATLGDVELKTFEGSMAQLATAEGAALLERTSPNPELRRLLADLDIPAKIAAGYKRRGIFVTNVAANKDARDYLAARPKDVELDVWDSSRLSPVLKQLRRDWFVPEESRLHVNPAHLFVVGPSRQEPKLLYAAVQAKELVRLPGIDDSRIFAQNVRLGLGGTRVNDDILQTVKDGAEHENFITFHNGLTIVAKSIVLRGTVLRIKDFSVCNGCQSLLTFFNHRRLLSDKLQVLVRFARVGDNRRLPEIIAYRTNNQNAISLRDLSSNDVTQVRLKAEFDNLFGASVQYGIKRGDTGGVGELPNELAGRLLLALYVGEPWSAHQKYRIFGDLEGQVFNYHIGAPHIRLAHLLHQVVRTGLDAIEHRRLAKYGLTEFLMLYLLGALLRLSSSGQRVLDDPLKVLTTDQAVNQNQDALLAQATDLTRFLATELNFTVKERGGESYDYRREFKSPRAVGLLRDEMLKAFEKDKYRGRVADFSI